MLMIRVSDKLRENMQPSLLRRLHPMFKGHTTTVDIKPHPPENSEMYHIIESLSFFDADLQRTLPF